MLFAKSERCTSIRGIATTVCALSRNDSSPCWREVT